MVAPSRAATRAVRPPAHVFDRAFYAKLAGVSFVIGAAFEAFMLKTDFYAKVVHIEAERRFLAEQRRDARGLARNSVAIRVVVNYISSASLSFRSARCVQQYV